MKKCRCERSQRTPAAGSASSGSHMQDAQQAEYQVEIAGLQRKLIELQENEAAPNLIDEYSAEVKILTALLEATQQLQEQIALRPELGENLLAGGFQLPRPLRLRLREGAGDRARRCGVRPGDPPYRLRRPAQELMPRLRRGSWGASARKSDPERSWFR